MMLAANKDLKGTRNIMQSITADTDLLCKKLVDNVNKLPNSLLWGIAEQHKRLKLLVELGMYILLCTSIYIIFKLQIINHKSISLYYDDDDDDDDDLLIFFSHNFFFL
jgi:hypothetical protein